MSDDQEIPFSSPIRVADLSARRTTRFSHAPGPDELARIAAFIGADRVRKLRFAGELRPEAKGGWLLEAELGGTVVQPCVVTLAPVTTRIDQTVTRRYVAQTGAAPGPEMEIPEDDDVEDLGAMIDPGAVMIEALALALPLYPRAEGAELGVETVTLPGAEPIAERENPFAALSGLRDRLSDDGSQT